jgi:PilZ domain
VTRPTSFFSIRTIPESTARRACGRSAAVGTCCDAGATAALARPLQAGALELAFGSLGKMGLRVGRRRAARVPVRIDSPSGIRRARVKDISASGLFLVLPDPLPLEAAVSLSMTLPMPEGRRKVRVRGVVVRQVENDPESHLIPGVGVRFVEIDRAAATAIDGFVALNAVGSRDEGATAGPGATGVQDVREHS